jgi:small subunit ribosomal protein S20
MANHPSAKKRVRRNARHAAVNKARVSRIRTFVKKVELAIGAGNAEEAKKALQAVQPEIQRGVSKGIMHKNTAARRISRMAARIKAMG